MMGRAIDCPRRREMEGDRGIHTDELRSGIRRGVELELRLARSLCVQLAALHRDVQLCG